LQGASLSRAQLQGAWLDYAQLQGASLEGAQLQGAQLEEARLQGGMLFRAELQGAALRRARLQGAWLFEAQLQGSTLQAAFLEAADLSHAFLWRTNVTAPPVPEPKAIRLSTSPDWRPLWRGPVDEVQPWDEIAYDDLRRKTETLPPPRGDYALANIRRLDCGSPDKTLAACNTDPSLPHEAAVWGGVLETAARINLTDYAAALAAQLRALVC
jgi:uncharacterized protein YjbI with pentapeptide repeats